MANDTAGSHPLDGLLDYPSFLRELVTDLKELRAGKITVAQARARAEHAKIVVRAVAVGLDAQRILMVGARDILALEAEEGSKK